MTDERLPDCRPPRRNLSPISAFSHPELLSGHLALQPGGDVPPTSSGGAFRKKCLRGAIGAVVLVAVGAFALPAYNQDSSGGFEARAQTREYKATCAPWDTAASDAIVQFVQGRPDMDLRQVSDAITRMRHARRLCESGWVRLACLDYDAIIRGAPSFEQPVSVPSMCWPAMLDPPAGITTRW